MLLSARPARGPGGPCAPPEVVHRYIFNVSVPHHKKAVLYL